MGSSNILKKYSAGRFNTVTPAQGPPQGFQGGAVGIRQARPVPRSGKKWSGDGTNSPTLGDYDLTRAMMGSLASTGKPDF